MRMRDRDQVKSGRELPPNWSRAENIHADTMGLETYRSDYEAALLSEIAIRGTHCSVSFTFMTMESSTEIYSASEETFSEAMSHARRIMTTLSALFELFEEYTVKSEFK